jgi:hypothetical protein
MFWWNCLLCKLKKSCLSCIRCCLNVLKDLVFSELHTLTIFWINTDINDRWMLFIHTKVNYFSTSLIPVATSAKLVVCYFIIALISNSKFCHVWSSYSQICNHNLVSIKMFYLYGVVLKLWIFSFALCLWRDRPVAMLALISITLCQWCVYRICRAGSRHQQS